MEAKFIVKHLEHGWELTNTFGSEEVRRMKRGIYPISITYTVVDIGHKDYPLCFTDSFSIALDIANALNAANNDASMA